MYVTYVEKSNWYRKNNSRNTEIRTKHLYICGMNIDILSINRYKTPNPMGFLYPCYREMFENNIIFQFNGIVTSDLVVSVLKIMGDMLEDNGADRKVSKKVFNVMVECFQGVYQEVEKDDPKFDPTAILVVKKLGVVYYVSTGRFIETSLCNEISSFIDSINAMDTAGIKSYYKELLVSELNSSANLTKLGIIDIARKSRQTLAYDFENVNDTYSFFSLEAKISANLL